MPYVGSNSRRMGGDPFAVLKLQHELGLQLHVLAAWGETLLRY